MSRSTKTFIFVFVASLVGLVNGPLANADDLFSEISISSVFSSESKEDDEINRTRTGRRLTGGHSIQRALAAAGLVSKSLGDGFIAVDMDLPNANGQKIKVALSVSSDHQMILLSTALVKVNSAKASSRELEELLRSRNDKSKPYYEYSTDWLRVRSRIANNHVSPSWLKSKIEELVVDVGEDVETWQALGKSLATMLEESRQKETLQKFQFAGTWTANANGSQYGFKFDETNFKLGIVSSGQITKSQGTWKLTGEELRLIGSGMILNAKVEVVSNDVIKLQIGSQPKLQFSRGN